MNESGEFILRKIDEDQALYNARNESGPYLVAGDLNVLKSE